METHVRPARADERELLENLLRAASLANEGDRADLLAHPEVIVLDGALIADGHVHVAQSDGQIEGYLVLLPRADGDQELDGLFVDPASWRRGTGRRLVDAARHLASARGARGISVIANPAAEEFYRACGFVHSGTAQTQFGAANTMRLTL